MASLRGRLAAGEKAAQRLSARVRARMRVAPGWQMTQAVGEAAIREAEPVWSCPSIRGSLVKKARKAAL